MWTKAELAEKLKAVAAERKAKPVGPSTPAAEHAALLYARWQGLTDEATTKRLKAKADLDRLLDTMAPEDWEGVDAVAEGLGDTTFKGLMLYSGKQALESTTKLARTIAKARDFPRR